MRYFVFLALPAVLILAGRIINYKPPQKRRREFLDQFKPMPAQKKR